MEKACRILNMEIERIERGVIYILEQTLELCAQRQMGMTSFKYKQIGEVFALPNACKVHVMPGYEESIMIVRGASLVALSRSHAEPIKKNMIWQMTVRRHKDGTSIPHTKNNTITDETIARLPAIIQSEASQLVQISATKLMEEYRNFRAQWKHKHEVEDAAKLVGQDLEGLIPIQPDKSNGFKQDRQKIRDLDVPKELDI